MVVELVFKEKPACRTRLDASRQVAVGRPGRVQMWARARGRRAPLCPSASGTVRGWGDTGKGL